MNGTVEHQPSIESYRARLSSSLPRLRDRIALAATRAGRDPAEVRLVAVTKSHPIGALEAALEAGLRDLGENRVEELERKVAELGSEAAHWHMIGHVQSRKAARVAAAADLVHSVDSLKLAQRLSRATEESGKGLVVLAQVNTSGEEAKGGFDAERAVEEVLRMAELPGLEVAGLMTMAPFVDDEGVLSSAFSGLREILLSIRSHDSGVGSALSMGMTNDLEIAIREGSTMVRIGTALFGERVR